MLYLLFILVHSKVLSSYIMTARLLTDHFLHFLIDRDGELGVSRVLQHPCALKYLHPYSPNAPC